MLNAPAGLKFCLYEDALIFSLPGKIFIRNLTKQEVISKILWQFLKHNTEIICYTICSLDQCIQSLSTFSKQNCQGLAGGERLSFCHSFFSGTKPTFCNNQVRSSANPYIQFNCFRL